MPLGRREYRRGYLLRPCCRMMRPWRQWQSRLHVASGDDPGSRQYGFCRPALQSRPISRPGRRCSTAARSAIRSRPADATSPVPICTASSAARPASVEHFAYSAAMKNSGVVWDDDTLAKYLRDPKAVHPRHQDGLPRDQGRQGSRRPARLSAGSDAMSRDRVTPVARLIDGRAIAAALREARRRGRGRVARTPRRHARARRGPGRRRSGEPGLCTQQGARLRRGRDRLVRAPPARGSRNARACSN